MQEHQNESASTPQEKVVVVSVAPTSGEAAPRSVAWAAVVTFFVFILLMATGGRLDSLAGNLLRKVTTDLPERNPIEDLAEAAAGKSLVASGVTFESLDLHPDLLYQPYLGGDLLTDGSAGRADLIRKFRDFLGTYEQRQGVDDNFTIRLLDGRTGETLEVSELEALRAQYQRLGQANWDDVDRQRRHETSRLIGAYTGRGYPKSALVVRWGRADQVREARATELPTIEYEIRLARRLGLSLLATEIGTVETFNQDRLISTVGARSRYQMMPYILEQSGINRYALATAGGASVSVSEEWHPLLTMEHSFVTVKSYANAVGHEIPGISAYHTGPGNIFAVYRQFITAQPAAAASGSVVDAYMWAVTDGYDQVSANSSFKTYSRGYVASAYGALQATDKEPLQPEKTLRTERVQVKPGAELLLSRALAALAERRPALRGLEPGESLYAAFVRMNPHITLPAPDASSVVAPQADVRFVSEVGGKAVRFFLPLGASEALAQAGLDALDPNARFAYDETTYADPNRADKTEADRAYDALVADIADFGFTAENKARLLDLKAQFETLAAQQPTRYRQMQLEIIRTHAGIWATSSWDRLAEAAGAVKGMRKAPAALGS